MSSLIIVENEITKAGANQIVDAWVKAVYILKTAILLLWYTTSF